MNLPTQIRAGDTYIWTISHGDYKASDGYAFTLYIRGAASLDIAGVASGDDFTVTLSAVNSALLVSGIYQFQGRFSKAGANYTPDGYIQTITVLADISAQAAGYDGRSHARKALSLIESAIEKYSVEPVSSITIEGQGYQITRLTDLFSLKKRYELELRYEEDEERIEMGLGKKKILMRFDRAS